MVKSEHLTMMTTVKKRKKVIRNCRQLSAWAHITIITVIRLLKRSCQRNQGKSVRQRVRSSSRTKTAAQKWLLEARNNTSISSMSKTWYRCSQGRRPSWNAQVSKTSSTRIRPSNNLIKAMSVRSSKMWRVVMLNLLSCLNLSKTRLE